MEVECLNSVIFSHPWSNSSSPTLVSQIEYEVPTQQTDFQPCSICGRTFNPDVLVRWISLQIISSFHFTNCLFALCFNLMYMDLLKVWTATTILTFGGTQQCKVLPPPPQSRVWGKREEGEDWGEGQTLCPNSPLFRCGLCSQAVFTTTCSRGARMWSFRSMYPPLLCSIYDSNFDIK